MPATTHFTSAPIPWDAPEVEFINGVGVPKVSPRRRHALLQGELVERLRAWARQRGEVGPEWRFVLVASGSRRTSLVPDVAFVSTARIATLSDADAEEPPFAPDIAIEIRSPGDRERTIQEKVALYLAHGARLVLDVDPDRARIVTHDADGSRTFGNDDVLTHRVAEGLSIDLRALFATLDRRRD
jgi:Uma2 family endonuclease